jgi:hypothetical protein
VRERSEVDRARVTQRSGFDRTDFALQLLRHSVKRTASLCNFA